VSKTTSLNRGAQDDGRFIATEHAVALILGETALASNQAIAERLVVTERAVEKHVTNIFGKLKLSATPEDHRRVLAVLAFLWLVAAALCERRSCAHERCTPIVTFPR
jgi:DNA-binding CsgD family transcriptional regulator